MACKPKTSKPRVGSSAIVRRAKDLFGHIGTATCCKCKKTKCCITLLQDKHWCRECLKRRQERQMSPYKCLVCGKRLVDVGGYWGCLCNKSEAFKEKYQSRGPVSPNDGGER